jgi:hypothetical protein
MKETYIAVSPSRYVRIYDCDIFNQPTVVGVQPQVLLSQVKAYRIDVDRERGCYDSYIKRHGNDEWEVWSLGKPLSSMLALDREIAGGHLYAKEATRT